MDKGSVYRQALETYGEKSQITMVFEEMAELQKELCKHLRGKTNIENIADEIADVEIMFEQMKLHFDIGTSVENIKGYKIYRLMQRLTKANEEVNR